MKDLIDIQAEMEINQDAIDEVYQLVAQEDITDVIAKYNTSVHTRMEQYQEKTARQKYAKNEAFKKMKENVWSARNDAAMPPVTEFIPKGTFILFIYSLFP